MKNEFVPYDIALALKELGYKGDIIGMYDEDKYLFTLHDQDDIEDEWLPAPLYQQCFRWFREKYNLHCNITNDEFGYYTNEGKFNTYEEAQDACLRKLIEIVNQNKDV